MGLFDLIKNEVKSVAAAKIDEINKKVEAAQHKIATTPVEVLLKEAAAKTKPKEPKQSRVAKQIINLYYADYPETPFISNERGAEWLERAELFPKQSIIPKSIMTRYADGLLPGHIYMLYWLKKHTNKSVPVYFEYKYGINFEKEKSYLYAAGYLDIDNKPTAKGEAAIKKHYSVIEKHTPPKPDLSIEGISKQILKERNNIIKEGYTEYTFLANSSCCEKCGELNGKHFAISDFKIGVNAPPMHEGCRCSIAAYEDEKAYREWLNSF